MKARQLMVSIVALATIAVPAVPGPCAQELGDPARGLSYAEKHCSECHAVRLEDDISSAFGAPPFAAIANTSGMTERAIGVWFQSSHPTMPMLVVPREDLDNVIAYIMSLKGKSPPANAD